MITAKRILGAAAFVVTLLALLGTISFNPAIAISVLLVAVAVML